MSTKPSSPPSSGSGNGNGKKPKIQLFPRVVDDKQQESSQHSQSANATEEPPPPLPRKALNHPPSISPPQAIKHMKQQQQQQQQQRQVTSPPSSSSAGSRPASSLAKTATLSQMSSKRSPEPAGLAIHDEQPQSPESPPGNMYSQQHSVSSEIASPTSTNDDAIQLQRRTTGGSVRSIATTTAPLTMSASQTMDSANSRLSSSTSSTLAMLSNKQNAPLPIPPTVLAASSNTSSSLYRTHHPRAVSASPSPQSPPAIHDTSSSVVISPSGKSTTSSTNSSSHRLNSLSSQQHSSNNSGGGVQTTHSQHVPHAINTQLPHGHSSSSPSQHSAVQAAPYGLLLHRPLQNLTVHDTMSSDLSVDLSSPLSSIDISLTHNNNNQSTANGMTAALNRVHSMPATYDETLSASAASYSIRVLLVETHTVHRQHVASKLACMACSVDQSETPAHALAMLKEYHYDICFLASELDRVSGLDLCLLMHSQLGAQCPILVLMSKSHDPEEADRAMTCGIDTIIHRPARTRELQSIIDIWHMNANKVLHRVPSSNSLHSGYGQTLAPSSSNHLLTPEPMGQSYTVPSIRSSASLSQLSTMSGSTLMPHAAGDVRFRTHSISASTTPTNFTNGNRQYTSSALGHHRYSSTYMQSMSANTSPQMHTRSVSSSSAQHFIQTQQNQIHATLASSHMMRSPNGQTIGSTTQQTYVASAPLDYKHSIQAGLKLAPAPLSPDAANAPRVQAHIRHPRSRPVSPGNLSREPSQLSRGSAEHSLTRQVSNIPSMIGSSQATHATIQRRSEMLQPTQLNTSTSTPQSTSSSSQNVKSPKNKKKNKK